MLVVCHTLLKIKTATCMPTIDIMKQGPRHAIESNAANNIASHASRR